MTTNEGAAQERMFTIQELAQRWQISEQVVRNMVQREPGVLRWPSSHKRTYTRIPESVAERIWRRYSTP